MLDGVFVFSVIWSVGGSVEGNGRDKFGIFLKKLLEKKVDPKPDRTDFDLGPGLEILDPGFRIETSIPSVRGCIALLKYAASRLLVFSCHETMEQLLQFSEALDF